MDNGSVRFCLDCGYDLRGLSVAACPECGRAFNANEPATTAGTRANHPLVRTIGRRVGWLLHAVVILLALAWLWTDSVPGGLHGWMVWTALGWLGAIAYWLLRASGVLIVNAWARRPSNMGFQPALHWLFGPGALLTVIVLSNTNASMWLRFVWSRQAMTRVAQYHMANSPVGALLPDQRIGSYDTMWTHVTAGASSFVFFIRDPHRIGICNKGFAYLPSGVISSVEDESTHLKHLTGDWWIVSRCGSWP